MKKGENMKKKIKIAVFMMFCIFAFTGCTNSSDKSKKVESVEDITGAKIGVQLGTTGDIYASDYEGDDAGTTVERYNKMADAVQALKQKKIDCVIIDEQPALSVTKDNDDLKILDEEFTNEDYAICIAKGNDDLKEKINYPKSFLNDNILSIGNNLENAENINSNNYEIEVVYRNGDKIKFNYQTGEIISSIEENSNSTSLFNYVKEKISELGNLNSGELQEITTKYEESKKLQNKLEKIPVEEALQRKNSNENKLDDVANSKNNQTNNSLKETRYISIYNAEKDDYQIYQEEELLDTSKQEVISENEKIEANNLKEYYASEGESRNKNMGILWITLSIVGVVIILFAIKKRD